MKIKTTDLIRAPLDWAMAKALGYDCQFDDEVSGPWLVPQNGYLHDEMPLANFSPSTRNHTVIDIMEREGIAAWLDFDGKTWRAADKRWTLADPDSEELARMSEPCSGPTLRIAVCRCFVASKLGDEVEVPDELVQGDLK